MASPIEILEDGSEIVQRARFLVLEAIRSKKEGKFALVVAGGSTPKPLYEALAQEDLDWSKIHIFWGDERYVAPTDPQSNEGMVRQAWLNRVNFPETNIHPMATGFDSTEEGAANYQKQLEEFFRVVPPELPDFDLVLLGMGDDGHTASLFPGTAALHTTDRWVTVGHRDGQPRLTLTYPAINNAKQIIFMVSGSNKSRALKAVLAPEGDSNLYPSRLIQGNVLWLIDRAAYGN